MTARTSAFRTLLVLACASLSFAACELADGGSVGENLPRDNGGPAAPTTPADPEEWPGGTLGAFEVQNGVPIRETGSPAAGSGDEGESWGGGADAGAAPADDWSEAAGGTSGTDDWSEGAGGGSEDDWGAADGRSEGDRGDTPDPSPAPALEGGEIDDNADFDAFLAFYDQAIAQFGDDPMVRPADVSERHLITVRDASGATVADATVSLLDDDGAVVRKGRTHADGRFGFFPRATGLEAERYTLRAEYGGVRGEISLDAETADAEIALAGAVERPSAALEIAFVIDCTGSMGEEIDRIKATVSTIAARIAADESQPALRLGLVEIGRAHV